MKKTLPALPPKTLEDMVAKWANVAKYRESACVYYYNKSDLLWRFRNLTDDKILYKKYFGTKKLHVIDLETELIDDPTELFDSLSQKSSHDDDVFFIIGVDRELLAGNTRLFSAIVNRDLWRQTGSYLLFFTIDFTHPKFRTLFGNNSSAFQNMIIHPLCSSEDALHYIKHQSSVWNMKPVSCDIAKHIVQQCAGHIFIVKEAVRYLRDHPKSSKDVLINHEQMHFRVEMIWQHFQESEKEALKKIALRTSIVNPNERHSAEFLQKAGYIHGTRITIPLLSQYIASHSHSLSLELKENRRIYANGLCIEESLSRKERLLLRLFIERKNTIVSRQDISSVLSNSSLNAGYSDWSIDQLVSRLRKTMAKLNIPPTMIQTAYGKGFIFKTVFKAKP